MTTPNPMMPPDVIKYISLCDLLGVSRPIFHGHPARLSEAREDREISVRQAIGGATLVRRAVRRSDRRRDDGLAVCPRCAERAPSGPVQDRAVSITKTCSSCKVEKPASAFLPTRFTPDGLTGRCRAASSNPPRAVARSEKLGQARLAPSARRSAPLTLCMVPGQSTEVCQMISKKTET